MDWESLKDATIVVLGGYYIFGTLIPGFLKWKRRRVFEKRWRGIYPKE